VKDGGRVDADVQAHSVDFAGEARGRISASSRVSLSETGVFEGEMETPVLEVSPGSVVCGRARVAGFPTKERRSSH
jgi:cytoskeletal protein CcmA (bactofilin family)